MDRSNLSTDLSIGVLVEGGIMPGLLRGWWGFEGGLLFPPRGLSGGPPARRSGLLPPKIPGGPVAEGGVWALERDGCDGGVTTLTAAPETDKEKQ